MYEVGWKVEEISRYIGEEKLKQMYSEAEGGGEQQVYCKKKVKKMSGFMKRGELKGDEQAYSMEKVFQGLEMVLQESIGL